MVQFLKGLSDARFDEM
jgi:ribosomal protein L37AE/L43A